MFAGVGNVLTIENELSDDKLGYIDGLLISEN